MSLATLGCGRYSSPSSSIIQSIQPFSITITNGNTSNTATITAVDTTKAVLFLGGFTTTVTAGTAYGSSNPYVALTNATTVTATRNSSTSAVTVRGTIVEFVSSAISSVQSGTIVLSGVTSNTATISSVDTSKSVVLWLGHITNSTSSNVSRAWGSFVLTNATTVTFSRSVSNNVLTGSFMVVEFASGILNSAPQVKTATATGASTTLDVTLLSTSTSNTINVLSGFTNGYSSDDMTSVNSYYQMTSTTNVRLTRVGTTTTSRTIAFTALEFASANIQSLQRGTTTIGGGGSTSSISAVDTAKSVYVSNWWNTAAVTIGQDDAYALGYLLDSTTVQGEKATLTSNSTIGWEILEFK